MSGRNDANSPFRKWSGVVGVCKGLKTKKEQWEYEQLFHWGSFNKVGEMPKGCPAIYRHLGIARAKKHDFLCFVNPETLKIVKAHSCMTGGSCVLQQLIPGFEMKKKKDKCCKKWKEEKRCKKCPAH